MEFDKYGNPLPVKRNSSSLGHSSPSNSISHSNLNSDMAYRSPLERPNPPFSQQQNSTPSFKSTATLTTSPDPSVKESASLSLSVNYLPTKFSRPVSPGAGGMYNRKNKLAGETIPKRGGGREAFRAGEARMPGDGDEDYDGVVFGARGKNKAKLRWNKFKWIMFILNLALSIYSLVALILCLLTWFNVWTLADVVRAGNTEELIISTIACSFGVLTSLIGWSGILLNNRTFLAIYNLLLWVTFAFLVAPGYMTYRRRTFNLEGKINAQWSRDLGVNGRLRIQNQLHCCGYFSPYIEASVSQYCYARSTLPGCKGPYMRFERVILTRWYLIAFSLVPIHLLTMVSALLCSNHVTYRFGKGMMPKAYRLSLTSMAVIMDQYATQLADQYGQGVASEIMSRAGSTARLDALAKKEREAVHTPLQSSPVLEERREIGYAMGSPTQMEYQHSGDETPWTAPGTRQNTMNTRADGYGMVEGNSPSIPQYPRRI